MDKTEENQIKIANYLDNQMNAAEEEAFMMELTNDADLRRQYEEELMVATILNNDEKNNQKQHEPAPVLPLWKKYRLIASIVLLIAAAGILYFVFHKDESTQPKIVSNQTDKSYDPSARKNQPSNPATNSPDAIFNQFYKPYSSENDPVELSNFYNDYKSKKYNSVIAAKESDYQTMGTDDKKDLLSHYLHFYKGLCWLEKNDAEKAIEEFNAASKSAPQNKSPYVDAQWWLVLALLKENEKEKAIVIAKKIVQSDSQYKNEASKLLTALGG